LGHPTTKNRLMGQESQKTCNGKIALIKRLFTELHKLINPIKHSKELLCFWVDRTESKSFWLGVLNDQKVRVLKDVSIFSLYMLAGRQDAIKAAYPKS